MSWYDSITYEIPESLDCVKKDILAKIPLIEKRKQLSVRLQNAQAFFNRDGLSQQNLQEGLKLLTEILAEIEQIDVMLVEKDMAIASTLEARVIDFNLKENIPSRINDLEEDVDGKSICIYNTDDNENKVGISASDVWFLKTAKKLFNVDANNIEIL